MIFSKHIFLLSFSLYLVLNVNANSYFISTSSGDDNNSGLSSQFPINSINKLNTFTFQPGDSILFKAGDIWQGMFWLKGSGDPNNSIVVDSYGGAGKATINGNGYQSCILIYNNEYISINNLNLYNEDNHLDSLGNTKLLAGFGGASNTWGSGKNVRFGVKIVATSHSLSGFRFNNLEIHNIYPTPTLSQNVHKGYGLKLETQSDTTNFLFNIISDVKVSNCYFHHTGHYGIWIKSIGLNNIDSVKNFDIDILNCDFQDTGGSGFVPNKSKNILVQDCFFNHCGSSEDNRMWKRGSGMWTFDCKNAIAQHNYFMNAHGPQDSYGAHIDYGNENVVFQYNYSYNNEGGFVEILGDNINCGYRYNISVNDGYRLDPNNTPWNKKGKIFWISNYCGSGPRCPNTATFIYNNTVFINDSINPEIYFWPNVGDVHVFNNIIYTGTNGQKIPTLLQNTLNTLNISHNVFYDSSRINLDTDLLNNAFFNDPKLLNPSPFGINDPNMYQLQGVSPFIGVGKLISGSSDTTNFLYNNGGRDYFGNIVSENNPPCIGAFNLMSLNNSSSIKSLKIKAIPTMTINNLTLKIKDYDGKIETEIFNPEGNKISKQNGALISLKEFKKGIYILRININGKMENLKVVRL